MSAKGVAKMLSHKNNKSDVLGGEDNVKKLTCKIPCVPT